MRAAKTVRENHPDKAISKAFALLGCNRVCWSAWFWSGSDRHTLLGLVWKDETTAALAEVFDELCEVSFRGARAQAVCLSCCGVIICSATAAATAATAAAILLQLFVRLRRICESATAAPAPALLLLLLLLLPLLLLPLGALSRSQQTFLRMPHHLQVELVRPVARWKCSWSRAFPDILPQHYFNMQPAALSSYKNSYSSYSPTQTPSQHSYHPFFAGLPPYIASYVPASSANQLTKCLALHQLNMQASLQTRYRTSRPNNSSTHLPV